MKVDEFRQITEECKNHRLYDDMEMRATEGYYSMHSHISPLMIKKLISEGFNVYQEPEADFYTISWEKP